MADKPSGRVGKLEYPIDRENQYNTKIKFQAIKVTPPKVSALGVENAVKSISNGESAEKNSGSNVPVANNLKVQSIPGEVCDLYVPIGGYQVNDGFDYAQSSLGLLGAGAMNAMNQGGSIAGSLMSGVSEAGQSLLDAFEAVAGDKNIGRVAQLRAAQLVPNEGARNALSIGARATMNPNIRTNFNGVSVREFNFQFQFIPCSPEESLAVKSIVQFFRFHAYPAEIGPIGESFSVGYEYPNMFKIRLLSNSGNRSFRNIGTPIKLCYLKAISTTYNPTSPVLHPDGSPTEIMMNLTFVEYKAQSRKDIENEDDDSFYHFENKPSGSQEDTRSQDVYAEEGR